VAGLRGLNRVFDGGERGGNRVEVDGWVLDDSTGCDAD